MHSSYRNIAVTVSFLFEYIPDTVNISFLVCDRPVTG